MATDGAFPTRGTILAYVMRWAEIYVGLKSVWANMPIWIYRIVGWTGRVRSQWKLQCRFPDVETAVRDLAPRPLLMIHGAKDAYIGPEIARALFDLAGSPKEFLLVDGAKHNRCRETDPATYRDQIETFFRKYGPRQPALPIVTENLLEIPREVVAEPVA